MLYNIVKQINWIDLFVLILLFRTCYVAVNTGVPIEIFKISGTLAAIYLSLSYFAPLGKFIHSLPGFKNLSLVFWSFSSFVLLAIVGYSVFLLLRKFFSRLIKLDTVTDINKWGGLIIGFVRGLLLASLITVMLVVSGSDYLKACVKDSFSGRRVFKIAPAVYKAISTFKNEVIPTL